MRFKLARLTLLFLLAFGVPAALLAFLPEIRRAYWERSAGRRWERESVGSTFAFPITN